ncbi:MAG TPA: hypothetical protein VFA33_09475 [Bryobacteraceae bacterium]|nr:hypothetical protein [Bryobacteraceae bacterium]
MKIALDKQLATTFGIGVGVVVVAVCAILYIQRGSHIELKGSILKVRTQALDENNSVAVVDFRFANPSDFPFVVRSVTVSVEGAGGQVYQGADVSEVDAKRLFQYYPLLGQKFNDSLLMRDRIPPRHTEDRMIAARFEIPVKQLDARKSLSIRIEDVDGPVSELVSK